MSFQPIQQKQIIISKLILYLKDYKYVSKSERTNLYLTIKSWKTLSNFKDKFSNLLYGYSFYMNDDKVLSIKDVGTDNEIVIKDISFFYCSYRVSFLFDITSSCLIYDFHGQSFFFDKMEIYLKEVIKGIIQIKDDCFDLNTNEKKKFIPLFIVSFVVIFNEEECSTILHEIYLSKENYLEYIDIITRKLRKSIHESFSQNLQSNKSKDKNLGKDKNYMSSWGKETGGVGNVNNIVNNLSNLNNNQINLNTNLPNFYTNDILKTLQKIIFIMDLLPRRASPIVIYFTDGNISCSNLGKYNNVLMKMNRVDISINIISLSSLKNNNLLSFGNIKNVSICKYITDFTGGVYISETLFKKISNKTLFDSNSGLNILSLEMGKEDIKPELEFGYLMNNVYRKVYCEDCLLKPIKADEELSSDLESNMNSSLVELVNNRFKILLCKKPILILNEENSIEINKDIFHIKKNIQELGFNFRSIPSLSITREMRIIHKELFEKYTVVVPIKRIVETRIRESFQLIYHSCNVFYFEIELIPDIVIIYEFYSNIENEEKQIKIRIKTSFERMNYLKIIQNGSQEVHPLINTITDFIKEIVANDIILNSLYKVFNPKQNLNFDGDMKSKEDFMNSHKTFWENLSGLSIHNWYRFFNIENIEVLIKKESYDYKDIVDKFIMFDNYEDYFNEDKDEKDAKDKEEYNSNLDSNFNLNNFSGKDGNMSIKNQNNTYKYADHISIQVSKSQTIAPLLNLNFPDDNNSDKIINKIEEKLFENSDMTIVKGNILLNYKIAFSSISTKPSKTFIKFVPSSRNKDMFSSLNGFCMIKTHRVYENIFIIYLSFFQCYIHIRREISEEIRSILKGLNKDNNKILLECSDKHLTLLLPNDIIAQNKYSIFTYIPTTKLTNNFIQSKTYKYQVLNNLHSKSFITQLIKLRLCEGFILVESNRKHIILEQNLNISRNKINDLGNNVSIGSVLSKSNQLSEKKSTAVFYKISINDQEIYIDLLVEPGSGYEYKSNENELRVFEEKTYFNSLIKYLKDNDKIIFDFLRNIQYLIKDIISKKEIRLINLTNLNHNNQSKRFEDSLDCILNRSDLCLFNKLEPFSTKTSRDVIRPILTNFNKSLKSIKSKLILDDKSKLKKEFILDNLSLYKEKGYRINSNSRIENFSIQEQEQINTIYFLIKDMFKYVSDYNIHDDKDNSIYYCKLLSSKSLLLIKFPSLDSVCACCHKQINTIIEREKDFEYEVFKIEEGKKIKEIIKIKEDKEKIKMNHSPHEVVMHIKYYIVDTESIILIKSIVSNTLFEINECKLIEVEENKEKEKDEVTSTLNTLFPQASSQQANFKLRHLNNTKEYQKHLKQPSAINGILSSRESCEKYLNYIEDLFNVILFKNSLLNFNESTASETFSFIHKENLIFYSFDLSIQTFINISSFNCQLFNSIDYYIDSIYNIISDNVKHIKNSTFHNNDNKISNNFNNKMFLYNDNNENDIDDKYDVFLIEIYSVDMNKIENLLYFTDLELERKKFKSLVFNLDSNQLSDLRFNIYFLPSLFDIYTSKPTEKEEKIVEINQSSSILFYSMNNNRIPRFIHLIKKDYYVKIPQSHYSCIDNIVNLINSLKLVNEINCLRVIHNYFSLNMQLKNSKISLQVVYSYFSQSLQGFIFKKAFRFNTVDKEEFYKLFNNNMTEYFSSFEYNYQKIFIFNWESNDNDILLFKDYYIKNLDDFKSIKSIQNNNNNLISNEIELFKNQYEDVIIKGSSFYIPSFIYMKITKNNEENENFICIEIEVFSIENDDKINIITDKIQVLLSSLIKKINKQILLINLLLTNSIDRRLLPLQEKENDQNSQFSLELTYQTRYLIESNLNPKEFFDELITDCKRLYEIKNSSSYFSTFNILSSDLSIFSMQIEIEYNSIESKLNRFNSSFSNEDSSNLNFLSHSHSVLNSNTKQYPKYIIIKYYGLKVPSQYVMDTIKQFINDRKQIVKTRQIWNEIKLFPISDLSVLNSDLYDLIKNENKFEIDYQKKLFLNSNLLIINQYSILKDKGNLIWNKINSFNTYMNHFNDIKASELNYIFLSSVKKSLLELDSFFVDFSKFNLQFIISFIEYLRNSYNFIISKIEFSTFEEKSIIFKNNVNYDSTSFNNKSNLTFNQSNHSISNSTEKDFVLLVKSSMENILILVFLNIIDDDCNLEYYFLRKADNKDLNSSCNEAILKDDALNFILKFTEEIIFYYDCYYKN